MSKSAETGQHNHHHHRRDVDNAQLSDWDDLEFDQVLGYFRGVAFRSNMSDTFFSGVKLYARDDLGHAVYLGFKHQCVSAFRQFLYASRACVTAEVDRACEVFDLKVVTHVEAAKEYDFESCCNGTTTRIPKPTDTLIWPYDKELAPWAHIAIISHVAFTIPELAHINIDASSTDAEISAAVARVLLAREAELAKKGNGDCVAEKSAQQQQQQQQQQQPREQQRGNFELCVGEVGIAEQNMKNVSWAGKCYGRLEPLHAILVRDASSSSSPVNISVAWKIIDRPNPIGWKKLDQVPLRPAVCAPHIKINPKALAPTRPWHWGRLDTPLMQPRIHQKPQRSEDDGAAAFDAESTDDFPTSGGGGRCGLSAGLQEVERIYRSQIHASAAQSNKPAARLGGSSSGSGSSGMAISDPFLSQFLNNFQSSEPRASAEWASVFYTNNEYGSMCYGATMDLARVMHRAVSEIIPRLTAAELVGTFGIPQIALERRGKKRKTAQDTSSPPYALHSGDDANDVTSRCLLGSLIAAWDPVAKSTQLRRCQLDSLWCFADSVFYARQYRADGGGGADGFGFAPEPDVSDEFCRHARQMYRALKIPNKQRRMLFLDWGPADELFRGDEPAVTAEVRRSYEMERCNSLVLFYNISEYLAKQSSDNSNNNSRREFQPILISGMSEISKRVVITLGAPSASGDEKERLHGATVQLLPSSSSGSGAAGGEGGEEIQIIWKSIPWALIFYLANRQLAATTTSSLSSSVTQFARSLIDLDVSDNVIVQQPLWTHVASHPKFDPWIRQWAKSLLAPNTTSSHFHDRADDDDDDDAACVSAVPSSPISETSEQAAERHARNEENERAVTLLLSSPQTAGMVQKIDPNDALAGVVRTSEKKEGDTAIWSGCAGASEEFGDNFYSAEVVYASCHLRSSAIAVEARLPKKRSDGGVSVAPAAVPVEEVLQPAWSVFVIAE